MANYLNKEGILYTQEEIEAAALENNVDIDTILSDNELIKEKPGKTQDATAKKPVVASKKQKQGSPSGNTSSGWNTKTQPKFGVEGIVDTFQTKKKVQEKKAAAKKADIKKSKAVVNSFVDSQTNFQNPFDTTIKTDPTDPFNTGAELDVSNIKYDYLEREDKKAMQFIKSKENLGEAEQKYNDAINDNQFIDYAREGAKEYYNELIANPLTEVANLFGANIDIKIGEYKPLENETKQAKQELMKSAKKGEKITPQRIQEKAKSIYIENQINDQRGKAAEEYFDNLGDKQLQEDLKIRQIAKKINTSDKARQYTMLRKVYNAQLRDFDLYADSTRKKYNDGTITPEEIAEYQVKAKEAKEAYGYLENINKDFPNVEKQLKTDTEKLDFYRLNYDDVEGNLKRFYASGLRVLGGALKIGGDTAKFLEEKITGNISPIGTGTNLSTIGGLMLEDADAETRDLKSITFDSVSNFGDFGKYMGNLFSDQIPIYASIYFGGTPGVSAVSLSSGGQKIKEMEDEVGANYDLGTKLLAGYGYAAAEFIPEKLGTLRMFENLKSTMSTVGKESRELFKEGMLKAATKTVGKGFVESGIEGGTEGLTEFLGMTIDEQLLGKKYTAQTKVKRIKEAGFGGIFMAGPMQTIGGANVLIAKELRNYATENELAESKKIVDRIDFLQNELATNVRLTKTESNQIKEEINRLADASISIIENSGDRVYNMTEEDMVSVVKINQKQADLKNSYDELIDSNFSNEIKAEKADELNKEFKVLEKERQRLLTEKYAEINKVVNNALVINDSIENITKIANSIGRVEFDNKIGDQKGIAVFNSPKELGDAYKIWLTKDNKNEDGTEKLTPAQIDSEVEQGMKSDGFKLPNGQIVINKAVAAKAGAINVGNHEFLHKILDSTFRDKKQGVLLVNQFLNVLSTKERAAVQKRIDNNYRYFKDENGNIVEKKFEDYAEEYLNVFIDEIKYENIKDKDNIKQLLISIAQPILKYFRKLGFNKIEFESGEDVYQFLKSYQKNISKGKISERAKKLIAQEKVEGRVMFSKSIEERMDKLDAQLSNNEIDLDKYELEMQKLEQEDFEESKKAYEEEKKVVKKEPTKKDTAKKEPTEVSEAAAKAKAKLDAIGNDPKGFNPNNPAIYDELDKMVKVKSRNYKTSNGTIIDLTNKNKGGLDGFSMEEMTSYVTVSMLPYIQKFDPSRNDSLYGYINAQLANRMKAALKSGQVADVVFTEDVTEMTKLSNDDVEVKSISLPERKRFQNILESGVFSPDVIESVQTKMTPLIRTLESKFNEKITLNQTVSPLIREIKNYIGTQADIDIKKAMGGKEDQVLQNWLITNKKTVLENLPTTWLMGKDNGKTVSGGMPFAVQKQVNGRWLNYPEWIGKKVDREAVTTDLAGRTSGHELVRRLPEVNKNVSVEEFLSSIIDLKTGSVIRGRKESLAKVMSEELTLDILIDDFLNDGPLFQLFVKNQEAKGILRDDIIVNDIVRQSERGNVKFSLTKTDIDMLSLNSVAFVERLSEVNDINKDSIKQVLIDINWPDDRIDAVAGALWRPIGVARKFFEKEEVNKNVEKILNNFGNVKDYGERMYQLFDTKKRVATFFRNKRNVDILKRNNIWFGRNVIEKYGLEKGLQLLKAFWGDTILKEKKDGIGLFNNKKEFNDYLIQIQEKLKSSKKPKSKKATINEIISPNNISNKFARSNVVYENYFNGSYDVAKDKDKTDAAKDFLIFASEWWMARMEKKDPIFPASVFTMFLKNTEGIIRTAAPVVGLIKDGEYKKGAYVFEHDPPARNIASLLVKKTYLKDDSISYEDIFNDYNVLIVPEKISTALDASGVKDMAAPFQYFPKLKAGKFLRYDGVEVQKIKQSANNAIQFYVANKTNTANEKALTNNLSQSKKSMSISTVSDFINANNLKRIDAETSFDVLNDLNKEIENYWGIVPNDIIVKMNRAVDYAFDVIEDRENEGGPLMAAVNDALNLETVKFAEKQLNEFIENNRPKGQQGITKFSLTSKRDLKWDIQDDGSLTYFNVNNKEYSIFLRDTGIFNYSIEEQKILNNLIKKYNLEEEEANLLGSYKGGTLNLGFSDENGDIEITGAKNAFEVFGVVINGVLDYIKNNGTEGLVFTAKEPSRRKLYNAMAETYADKLGWNAFYEDGVYIVSKYPKTIKSTGSINNNKSKGIKYSKSPGDYTTVYAGAPIGKNLKEIGRKGVNFFATDKREADEYARMNDGVTQEFVINKNNIVNEDVVFDKIKELGLEPVSNKYTVDEQMLYELIDPRFGGALSSNDITTLFNALRKDGVKAISYTDGAQVTGNTTKSIAVIDTSVLDSQTNTKFSKSLDFEFNDILERNTGVTAFTKVSDVVAKRTGIKKNTLSFFVPPSADDFRGLTTYMFAGKGKQGELDQEFFDKNLTVPYVKGINTLDSVRQSIRKEYKMLLNNFPDIKKKLEKLTPDKGFTYDQAVRVYLWSNSGKEIPGLSRLDKNKLLYFVKQNPDLMAFANALSITGRQDGGWIDPSTTWDSETIISDLHNITEGAGRKKYLEEFIENADAIFTKENLNKIQSIYGTNVREALEDSLYRMKNGKNRPEGTDRITNKWMNWINGSTAAIMFFNTRSALLQTISAMNFLNWSDNNPYMAGKAFINQKQYWADFAMIINSDKLKERRSGLKADVTQAEIANAANSTKNKFNGVISYLQKIGFTPTQAADSFSIAVSGATFYRNRVNTYLKAGNTQQEAEEKAFNDFSIITDQSMQSADPMYVSKQQTTALGRIILAFGNTPMQYNRLIKKATLDLVNKRGNWRTNVSKIVYYGALQNILFSALQSALFIPLGYDDDEELDTSEMTKEEKKAYEKLQKKQEDKITNMINGMADTLLRGSGVYGAAIATVKNTIMEYFKQEEKEMFADHAYTVLALTSVSPPISSKARKLYGSIRISKFEKDVIAERGWEVTRDGKLNLSPNYRIAGNIAVATTNLPLDRVVEKVNNMAEVMDSRNTKLQRGALALGWKDWELNVKNEENETIKATAKKKRKEEGIEKAIETRAENKRLEKEKFNKMSIQEKIAFRLKKAKERREKRINKRKMG